MFTQDDPFGGRLRLHPAQVRSSFLTGAPPSHYAFGHPNNLAHHLDRHKTVLHTYHTPLAARCYPVGLAMLGDLPWNDPSVVACLGGLLVDDSRRDLQREIARRMKGFLEEDIGILERLVKGSQRVMQASLL